MHEEATSMTYAQTSGEIKDTWISLGEALAMAASRWGTPDPKQPDDDWRILTWSELCAEIDWDCEDDTDDLEGGK
jgi:hypothetical protein